jgi:hypothetical protein
MAEKTEATMEERIDKAAIELLSWFRPGSLPKPDEAVKITQALSNLAHARPLLLTSKK